MFMIYINTEYWPENSFNSTTTSDVFSLVFFLEMKIIYLVLLSECSDSLCFLYSDVII